MPYYLNQPPQGPLARIVTAIIAIFALIGSFMIGLAAFLVIAGMAVIAVMAFWFRVAWTKRKLKKNGMNQVVEPGSPGPSGRVIDAEYTVVSETKTEKD